MSDAIERAGSRRIVRPPSRRELLAAICVLAAGIWLLGLLRFRDWIATGDHAIFQLRLERMADGHVPLDGAFSRFGAHHPGPAREWLVGTLYWLSGGRTAALPATAIVVNWSFLAAAVVAAWRTGGRTLALAAAAGGSLLVWGLAADLHSTWNPYLPVVAGHAAVWGVVGVATDTRRWVLPVVAGSVLAQVHATGFVAGIVTIGAALVYVVLDARRRGRSQRALIACGVTILLWSGPLVDLVNGGGWNLADLASSASEEPRVGLGRAADHVAQKVMPWSIWQGETRNPSAPPEPPPTAPVAVLLVVLVLLAWLAWLAGRSRTPGLRTLAVVAIAACTIATISFSLLRGFEHMYLFAPVVGTLVAPFETVIAAGLERVPTAVAHLPEGLVLTLVIVSPLVASFRGWTEYESIQSSPFDRGLRGAVVPEVRAGASYTIVAYDMVGVSAEGDVALYVQQSGGRPRSVQPNLDLPSPRPSDDVFVVAMGEALRCLAEDTGARELIVAESSDVGLPVGVFLVAGDPTGALPLRCG
ncbi:MAG: hypothetical protein HKN41_02840 [Ilumatobacter sp.]|nr:hypothetical protein [Ilumatobacter sp.]